MKVLAAMAGMAALLACSPQTQAGAGASSEPAGAQAQAPEAAVHPVSGLAVVPLTVTSGAARRWCWRASAASVPMPARQKATPRRSASCTRSDLPRWCAQAMISKLPGA